MMHGVRNEERRKKVGEIEGERKVT